MERSTPVVWASSPPYHPPPRTQLKELASELGGTLSQGLAALYPRGAVAGGNGGSSGSGTSDSRRQPTAASPSPASTPTHPTEASLPIDVYDAGRERVLSVSFHRVRWEELELPVGEAAAAAGPTGRVTGDRRVLCVGYTHGFHVRALSSHPTCASPANATPCTRTLYPAPFRSEISLSLALSPGLCCASQLGSDSAQPKP